MLSVIGSRLSGPLEVSYMLCCSQNIIYELLEASNMLCGGQNELSNFNKSQVDLSQTGSPKLYKPSAHFAVAKTDSPNLYKPPMRL